MKPTLYIAGKVTGLPYKEVLNKFKKQEDFFVNKGWEVVNPIKLINNEHMEWDEAMKICIKSMIDCHIVVFLPCYKESKGAMIEFNIAKLLNIPVRFVEAPISTESKKINLAP